MAPIQPLRDGRHAASRVLGVLLCVFTLVEVNYPLLAPQSRLALFALAGLALCFLHVPIHPSLKEHPAARAGDFAFAILAACCCGYIVVQTDPLFEARWIDGQSLGNRAGFETAFDTAVGLVGLLLVIEAARRALGLACRSWRRRSSSTPCSARRFPTGCSPTVDTRATHRGADVPAQPGRLRRGAERDVHLRLPLRHLRGIPRATGATRFIVDFAERVFGRSSGGPAKVAVSAAA